MFEPAGWHISVAGRGSHFLIGAAREHLGVDIEILVNEPLPRDQLSDREKTQTIGWSDQDWTKCWAAKEAHAKRLGIASAVEPATVTALPDTDNGWKADTASFVSRCHFLWADEVLLAVAIDCARPATVEHFKPFRHRTCLTGAGSGQCGFGGPLFHLKV